VSAQQAEPYAVPDEGSRSVLLFTSTTTEPSRPKVVANLAATYAEAGEKVIVISTSDLDSGSYIGASGASTGPVTPADIEAALVPASPDGVSLLSFGHFMANSGQLVNRAGAVLTAAREVADVILIETPGFLAYHHAEALVHSVDAVVVICENGATQVPDAQDMGDVLRRLGAPVLGVTFTGEELSAEVRKALAGPKMVATKSKKPSKKKGDGAADEVAPDVVAGDGDLDAVELAASDAEHGDPAPTPELHPS
jgi:Mrp family chromosome partitioning ATPase